MYVISGTSGNKLPAIKIRESKLRKFFKLPWILVVYVGTNLKGSCTCKRWYKPAELVD